MGSLVAELAEKLSSATNNFDIDEGTIYVNTSADTVAIGGTSPDGKFSIHQSASADILNLYDGTTAVFTVLDGGNVGIGTTAPGKLLHLHGASTDGIRIGVSGQSYYHDILSNGDGLLLSADASDAGGVGADIRFNVGNSEKMRIKESGSVGIGTTAPNQNLDVLNTAQITGAEGTSASLYLVADEGDDNGDGWRINSNQDANDLTISNNTTGSYVDKVTILTNGRVGIGSSTPTTTLDVAGEVTVASKLNSSAGTSLTLQSPTGAAVIINTDGANERVRITSTGKVGIGNGSPISPLHIGISATDSIPTNTLAQQTDNNVIVLRNESNSANYSGLKLETRTSGAAAWLIANEWQSQYLGDLVFRGRSDGTNSSERMRIKADGKVGIGTSSPAQLLDIVSATSSSIRMENTGDAGTTIRMDADRSAENGGIGSIVFKWNGTTVAQVAGSAGPDTTNKDDGKLVFSRTTSGGSLTARMTIDDVGRVGIGTTSAKSDALLHVKTSTKSVNLLVESTEAGASTSGFGINLYRNSASAADNDVMSNIRFIGKNDAGSPEDVTYAQMYAQIIDASDGSEDGQLWFQTMAAGALRTSFAAYADGLAFPQGSHYMLGGAKMLSGVTDIAYMGHSYAYTLYLSRWSSNTDYHFSVRAISAGYGAGGNTSTPHYTYGVGTHTVTTAYSNSGYKLTANPGSAGTHYFLLMGNGYTKPYLL